MMNPASSSTRFAARRMTLFLAFSLMVTIFISQGFFPVDSLATENGGGAYPNGAEDFMSGAVPPPGFYFINYFTYYSSDKFKIKDDGEIPDFRLRVTADTLRFIYVTKQQIFGGFWGMHIFLPFLNEDVTLPAGSQTKFGIGDIIVDPVILSWHTKNWHFSTGLDIFMPTGSFEKDRITNIGRNYWTFEPIAAFTFLSDGGFEVSSKFMYDFNTKNNDTDYLSGQEFHFDYTVGYRTGGWSLGLGGYFYKQITDDRQNGQKVALGDGFKGQVFALGPEIKYDYKNVSFTLKYQKEMDVTNKPEGDKFWFKFLYIF
jgi:hypothetical protein